MEYLLRQMCPEDIDEVLSIEKQTFSDPWSREDFVYCCANEDQYCPVVIVDGHVAGYAMMTNIVGECEIGNIAVSGEHRRKGFGRTLMDSMLAEALRINASRIMLEVRDSNVPARTLYDSYGFVQVGLRKEYYSHPTEDAILMDLVLSGEE